MFSRCCSCCIVQELHRLEDDEYFKDGNKDSRMKEKRGRSSKKKKRKGTIGNFYYESTLPTESTLTRYDNFDRFVRTRTCTIYIYIFQTAINYNYEEKLRIVEVVDGGNRRWKN